MTRSRGFCAITNASGWPAKCLIHLPGTSQVFPGLFQSFPGIFMGNQFSIEKLSLPSILGPAKLKGGHKIPKKTS